MSLDITLRGEQVTEDCMCPTCLTEHKHVYYHELYSANITHNLNRMAGEAGLYEVLWRPDENGIETASQLIEPLKKGIGEMTANPDRFKAFDAPNGWGTYENFVPWLNDLLLACEENPTATISVSR